MKKLSEFFDNTFPKNVNIIIQLNSIWKQIVGEQISKITLPIKLNKKILNVMVFDPMWQHELTFFKEDILEKIPKKFDINDIKFFVQYKKLEKEEKHFRELTDKENKIIERIVNNIQDHELKLKIKNALTAYFRNFSYEESLFLE